MNKQELEQEVIRLQGIVQELTEQIAARDAALSHSGEDGWLITTTNRGYSGVTAGVEFRGGRGFVPASRPGAEMLVRILTGDFGYRAQRMTAQEFQGMAPAEVTPDHAREQAEVIAPPAVFGG